MKLSDSSEGSETGIVGLLEPEVVGRSDDSVQIIFDVKPEFTITPGVVQGGIVASMLDMAMAMASDGPISTASMHLEVLRPATGPRLRVDGRVAQRGRRIVFAEAEMHTDDGTLVARGRQTAVPLVQA